MNSQTHSMLLVCDIDNTLTGSRSGLADLKAWLGENDHAAFAIATGRALPGTLEVIGEWNIPVPRILITAVGAEIYYSNGKTLDALRKDHEWEQHWDADWKPSEVMTALSSFPWLELQSATEQRPGKLSFFLENADRLDQVRQVLSDRGLDAQVIYSHGEFLDVLPNRASKGLAVEYVADQLNIPLEQVIAAGDSGNDFSMLEVAGLAIVVANHSDELDDKSAPSNAYFAENSYAEGVVEGLAEAKGFKES